MEKTIVVVAAKRTPIGSLGGSLSSLCAPELGAVVIKALLQETNIQAEQVDEVILGNVLTTGVGQNPARQAAILAGLPVGVPATTVNVVCGSGLKAVHMGVQSLLCGDAEIVIAGGQESMSQSPHFVHMRAGVKMGNVQLKDSMVSDGLTDAYKGYHMGITAENIVEYLNISREEQDVFAFESQQKAAKACDAGVFDAEIVNVAVSKQKGETGEVCKDEYIKKNTALDKLGALRPAFKPDGTVTAGNSSGLNDGAAAVLMMSKEKADELGLPVLAVIRAYASVGVAPELMGLGPVDAVRSVLAKADWHIDDVELFELNEAFAAQALGVQKELGLSNERVNVNGGAIALGHPIGASGCRILVSLIYEMQRSAKTKGVASLCVGGGMGLAVAVERI